MSAYLIAEERRKMEVSCIVSSLIRFHCLCLVNDDVNQPYQGTHISTISQPDVKCGSFIFLCIGSYPRKAKKLRNRVNKCTIVHFAVVCLVAKPLNRSEAKGDLIMIQILLA